MFTDTNFPDRWEDYGDQELWIAFRKGNRDAFSVLFLRYYQPLFRYGMNFSTVRETVKDSIQKLFYRLWEKRNLIDTPQSVQAYLYVSLRRILLRLNKRENSRERRNAQYLEQGMDGLISIEEEIILEEERKKREELYKSCIKALTPRQKEALLLRVDNGMSNTEIAGIMGITEKRVRNLIYESIKRLRREIYEQTE
ncbi:sigma-70 family RNA polymerase sigma factor [Aliifodinibius sp. S!AR15-10]|uniref:RNA polymerase sigma factor n=1 Tax=Aliifodinibius sp. S!AR15-10 TaxID=2950437 RepID=UPI0028659869|nr:sigma-70 family RNA polymerase sigma factor [Aliifodinibius sp. S!AR15-10]MDR8394080.1 sigma-70 family RNA polymerase sigma factor [Aliifodinibius sp. S!AR15-10]